MFCSGRIAMGYLLSPSQIALLALNSRRIRSRTPSGRDDRMAMASTPRSGTKDDGYYCTDSHGIPKCSRRQIYNLQDSRAEPTASTRHPSVLATCLIASGKPQICFFCFSKQNKREKAKKAGKLRDSQAGSTAIKRELKHEKQCAVFLMSLGQPRQSVICSTFGNPEGNSRGPPVPTWHIARLIFSELGSQSPVEV